MSVSHTTIFLFLNFIVFSFIAAKPIDSHGTSPTTSEFEKTTHFVTSFESSETGTEFSISSEESQTNVATSEVSISTVPPVEHREPSTQSDVTHAIHYESTVGTDETDEYSSIIPTTPLIDIPADDFQTEGTVTETTNDIPNHLPTVKLDDTETSNKPTTLQIVLNFSSTSEETIDSPTTLYLTTLLSTTPIPTQESAALTEQTDLSHDTLTTESQKTENPNPTDSATIQTVVTSNPTDITLKETTENEKTTVISSTVTFPYFPLDDESPLSTHSQSQSVTERSETTTEYLPLILSTEPLEEIVEPSSSIPTTSTTVILLTFLFVLF